MEVEYKKTAQTLSGAKRMTSRDKRAGSGHQVIKYYHLQLPFRGQIQSWSKFTFSLGSTSLFFLRFYFTSVANSHMVNVLCSCLLGKEQKGVESAQNVIERRQVTLVALIEKMIAYEQDSIVNNFK